MHILRPGRLQENYYLRIEVKTSLLVKIFLLLTEWVAE